MTTLSIINRIQSIPQSDWCQLFGQQPLVSIPFLAALEESQSLNPASGWQPQHLLLQSDHGQPLAALPLYRKLHSYGEYVFDWSWANASQQAQIPYYPKLVTALPFTPTVGPRLGLTADAPSETTRRLLQQLTVHAAQQQASSWHLLFADDTSRQHVQSAWPEATPLLERHDCQFHWLNRDYRDFDHFLECFNSRKRKSIRRERRQVHEQGVRLNRLSGNALELDALRQFFHFYQLTYQQRGQRPYLNWNFFERIHAQLRDSMMLVSAKRDRQAVGAALFLFDQQRLYGRWWGGLPEINCLHFEACYYQGIEFAIEHRLQLFDPGTQGEHKLLRGFEPTRTTSLHWIRHLALRQAVARSLQQERLQIEGYIDRARLLLPFKQRHNQRPATATAAP